MSKQQAFTIGAAILFWLATMATLALSGPIAGNGESAGLITGAITVPLTLGLTLLFIKWSRVPLRDYGFTINSGSWGRFGAGLLLGFLLIAIQTTIMWLGGGISWVRSSPAPSMFVPILGYVLLATREELAFRGYPLRLLASRINPWFAQAVVATLFAIEHRVGGSSWQSALLGSGVGSLVFGMAALTTRGLALPIGLHAAWNIGDWARGGKGAGGIWYPAVNPGAAAHVAMVAMASYVALMLATLVGLWLSQRRRVRRA